MLANKGWKVLEFSDCILQINTGLNPRQNFSLGNGNIKYITAKNLTEYGTIDFSKCDFVDDEAKQIIHRRSDIEIGDILFSSRAPIGHCHLIREKPDYFDIGESIFSIRVNREIVSADYLCLYLMSDYFVESASFNTTGSIIKEIRIGDLMNTQIIVPPIPVQKKIAQCIEVIDRKLELNRQINDNLQHQLKLMYDYWFTQFDFPDENGKPYRSSGGAMVWNEQLRKEIPKGWKASKFNSILDILKDGTHNPPKRVENGIPLLTGTMFEDCFLDYSKATFITKNDYEAIHSQYAPQAGDIIITKIGTIGNVNYLREIDIPIAIHCNSALLRFKADYDSTYSLFMCKSQTFQKRLEFAKGQSVQAFVSLDRIGSILVEIPPSDITKMFNQKTEKMLKALINISLENSRLIALRDWLLPMLMNGQATIAD